MRCFIIDDYPCRLARKDSSVVHAAKVSYFSYKAHKTACGRTVDMYESNGDNTSSMKKVENSSEITCKSCIKALGFDKEEGDGTLWVVREKQTGMYFNSSAGRHQQWVQNPSYAYTYRSERGAMYALNYFDEMKYEAVPVTIALKEQDNAEKRNPEKVAEYLKNANTGAVHKLLPGSNTHCICGFGGSENSTYCETITGPARVTCGGCLNVISETIKSEANDDTYYEIVFKDGSHEIVTDTGSAQEAAEWAADVFDFKLSDIIYIRRYKFEKEIFPIPTGIKFED